MSAQSLAVVDMQYESDSEGSTAGDDSSTISNSEQEPTSPIGSAESPITQKKKSCLSKPVILRGTIILLYLFMPETLELYLQTLGRWQTTDSRMIPQQRKDVHMAVFVSPLLALAKLFASKGMPFVSAALAEASRLELEKMWSSDDKRSLRTIMLSAIDVLNRYCKVTDHPLGTSPMSKTLFASLAVICDGVALVFEEGSPPSFSPVQCIADVLECTSAGAVCTSLIKKLGKMQRLTANRSRPCDEEGVEGLALPPAKKQRTEPAAVPAQGPTPLEATLVFVCSSDSDKHLAMLCKTPKNKDAKASGVTQATKPQAAGARAGAGAGGKKQGKVVDTSAVAKAGAKRQRKAKASNLGAAVQKSGPVAEGAAVEGAAVEGAAVEGAAVEGAAVEGAAVEGAAVEGAAVEGAAVEGAAVEGAVKYLWDELDLDADSEMLDPLTTDCQPKSTTRQSSGEVMIIHWYDQGSLPQPGCLLCVERTTNVATPWAQCVSPWFVSVSEDEPQKDPLEAFYRIAVVALSPGGTSHIIIDVTKKQEDFVRSCQLTDLRVYFVSQGRGVVTRNKPSGSHFIGITARKDLSDQLDAYPRPTAGSALYFVVLKVSLDINAAAEAKLLRKYEDDPDSKSPTDVTQGQETSPKAAVHAEASSKSSQLDETAAGGASTATNDHGFSSQTAAPTESLDTAAQLAETDVLRDPARGVEGDDDDVSTVTAVETGSHATFSGSDAGSGTTLGQAPPSSSNVDDRDVAPKTKVQTSSEAICSEVQQLRLLVGDLMQTILSLQDTLHVIKRDAPTQANVAETPALPLSAPDAGGAVTPSASPAVPVVTPDVDATSETAAVEPELLDGAPASGLPTNAVSENQVPAPSFTTAWGAFGSALLAVAMLVHLLHPLCNTFYANGNFDGAAEMKLDVHDLTLLVVNAIGLGSFVTKLSPEQANHAVAWGVLLGLVFGTLLEMAGAGGALTSLLPEPVAQPILEAFLARWTSRLLSGMQAVWYLLSSARFTALQIPPTALAAAVVMLLDVVTAMKPNRVWEGH